MRKDHRRSATVLDERTPADLTRDRFDEEVRRRLFAAQRLVDNTRREAGFASTRLGLVTATRAF
jgi:hypothetical protein